jgi:hypothetical protein
MNTSEILTKIKFYKDAISKNKKNLERNDNETINNLAQIVQVISEEELHRLEKMLQLIECSRKIETNYCDESSDGSVTGDSSVWGND